VAEMNARQPEDPGQLLCSVCLLLVCLLYCTVFVFVSVFCVDG